MGKPKPQKNRQTPEKAGLTFSEKKRLSELRRVLAGNSKEQAKPDTAQKTITFKKMYRDGICQVTDAYYTKMVEFFDINYDLLEVEDQADILEEYSKLINYSTGRSANRLLRSSLTLPCRGMRLTISGMNTRRC